MNDDEDDDDLSTFEVSMTDRQTLLLSASCVVVLFLLSAFVLCVSQGPAFVPCLFGACCASCFFCPKQC